LKYISPVSPAFRVVLQRKIPPGYIGLDVVIRCAPAKHSSQYRVAAAGDASEK
jgi:hypothetical protein